MRSIIIKKRGIQLILKIVFIVAFLVILRFMYFFALDYYENNLKLDRSSSDGKSDTIIDSKDASNEEALLRKLNQPFTGQDVGKRDMKDINSPSKVENTDLINTKINSSATKKMAPEVINESINKPFNNY